MFHSKMTYLKQTQYYCNDSNDVFELIQINRDGNCLYRALSEILLKDSNRYVTMKNGIMQFLDKKKNSKLISNFVYDCSIANYVENLKKESEFGTEICIYAAARVFKADIYVFKRWNYY